MSGIRDMLRALKKGATVRPSSPPVVDAAEEHHNHDHHQHSPVEIFQSTTSLSTEPSAGSRCRYSNLFMTSGQGKYRSMIPSRCDPRRNSERGRLRGCALCRSLLRNHRLVNHHLPLSSATSVGRRDGLPTFSYVADNVVVWAFVESFGQV